MLCVAVGQRIDGMPAFEKDDRSALELFILECGRGCAGEETIVTRIESEWSRLETMGNIPATALHIFGGFELNLARSVLRTLVSMHDSNRGGLCLLDPCVGSGTTIFAATTCLPKDS